MYELPQQVIQPQMHQPYQAADQNEQQQSNLQQQPQQQQPYQTVIQNQVQPIQSVAHHQALGMQQQQSQHQPQNSNQNSQFDTFDSIKSASAAPAQQSHANRYANNIGYGIVFFFLFNLATKVLKSV